MDATTRTLGAVLMTLAMLQTIPLSWAGRPTWAAEAATPASTSLEVMGVVENPRTYKFDDLQAKPATVLAVYYSTSKGPVTATYKGVLLWSLLQEAGIKTNPAIHNDILRRTLRVVAADGYEAAVAMGEIVPSFGGAQAIVAYEQDGAPLPGSDGFARLIMPGDKAGGRNIFALSRIEVR